MDLFISYTSPHVLPSSYFIVFPMIVLLAISVVLSY